jgi:hypothetical protein
VVSIDRPLIPLHFRRLKKIALYKAKHVFERLNNYLCKLIEKSAQRCKNMIECGSLSGFFSIAVVTFFQSGKKISANDFLSKISAKHCTVYILHFADFFT